MYIHKEIRKLQKTSKETYILSVPITWIRQNNLSKGSEIEITTFKDKVVLVPYHKELEKIIDSDGKTLIEIKHLIVSSYINGFDKIRIKNLPAEFLEEIKEFTTSYLIGAIVKIESSKSLSITFSIPDEFINKTKVLEHLFYLAEEFIKILLHKTRTKRKRKQKEMLYIMDKEVDKHYYLSLRMFPTETISKYAYIIENICDSMINIAELKINSKKENEAINKILEYILEKYRFIISNYYFKSIDNLSSTAHELKLKSIQLRKRRFSFLNEPIRLLKDLAEVMIDEITAF